VRSTQTTKSSTQSKVIIYEDGWIFEWNLKTGEQKDITPKKGKRYVKGKDRGQRPES
jgi:hypothetical protein